MNVDHSQNDEIALIKMQLSNALHDALTSKNTLKQFRSRCSELEAQLAHLNAELVMKEAPSSRHLESKIETLKQVVNDQAAKIHVIEKQKAVFAELEKALREQNSTLFLGLSDYKKQQDENALLLRRIAVKEEEQKALQAELNSIEAELNAISAQSAVSKVENERLLLKIAELTQEQKIIADHYASELENAQREMKEIQSRLSVVSDENISHQNENARLLDLLSIKEEERKNLNGNYSYEIEKNKKDLAVIQSRLATAEEVNSQLRSEKNQLIQVVAEHEQTIQANLHKIEEIEARMAELDSEGQSLAAKLKVSIAAHEASEAEVARLSQELTASDDENEKNGELIFGLRQQLKAITEEAKAAHQDISRLSHALTMKEEAHSKLNEQHQQYIDAHLRVISEFESRISGLNHEAKTSADEIARLSNAYSFKEKTLQELQITYAAEVTKNQKTITEITTQLKAVSCEQQASQQEIARLHETLSAKEDALSALNTQLQKEISEGRIRTQEIDSKLRSAIAENKASKEKHQTVVFDLESKLRNVTNELHLAREEIARLHHSGTQQEKTIQDLQTANYNQQLLMKKTQGEKFDLESRLNSVTHDNKLYHSNNARLTEALTAKEQAFDELTISFQNEVDQSKQAMFDLQTKLKNLAHENDSLMIENKKVLASVPKASRQVKNREERVRAYGAELQKEKIALRVFAEELLAELTIGSQLNPSRDLLKITEFELSKLESELIKTPTSSPARKSMENAVQELITQRDFLRTTCENSAKEWSHKIEKLARFTKDLRLEEMPPLPPAADDGKQEESGYDQKT